MAEQRMICEGSGCPVHNPYGFPGESWGVCSMCGESVPAPHNGIARIHTRLDLLAMIDDGHFDKEDNDA